MNIIGAFILVVVVGFMSTTINRTFFIDNNWKDGDPCLIDTPNGVFASDHCYGHPRK